MTTTAIRKKLHGFIETAEDETIKAMFILLEHEIEKGNYSSPLDEKSFVAEMDRRYQDYKNGSKNFISLEEMERKARSMTGKTKAKKAS